MKHSHRYFIQWFLISIYMSFFVQGKAQLKNTLTYFLKTAQSNSPLLNDYNNQIITKRIDSLKLKANYGFIISGEANGSYAPNLKGWGYDKALTNGQSLFAGVRVVKEIIGSHNMKTRLNQFNVTIAQLMTQKNISSETLLKQITDQYIVTYASQQYYHLSQEINHLLTQEDLALKKLTQASVFKQTEYLAFKVTLQQNELTLEQQKAEWQNNYAILNYISGIIDTVFASIEPPVFDSPAIARSFDESIYRKAFNADSLKLINDAQIIQFNYIPRITAFSDAGYQSSLVLNPYKNLGLSIGLAISLPLYDGRQKQMLLQQNQVDLQTRQKYLEQAERQYQQQVLQITNQMLQYTKMLETANEQIIYAKTLVEANAKQLPTGDIKVIDFILSINNLLGLKGNIIQYQTNMSGLKNQLQYLILP